MTTNSGAVSKRRLEVLHCEGPDSCCQTFILHGEDHTLGNALRYMIMKNPEVQFCGYTIPHPLENKIHLRIQTHGISATDALEQGLKDLYSLCNHVLSTFESQIK